MVRKAFLKKLLLRLVEEFGDDFLGMLKDALSGDTFALAIPAGGGEEDVDKAVDGVIAQMKAMAD